MYTVYGEEIAIIFPFCEGHEHKLEANHSEIITNQHYQWNQKVDSIEVELKRDMQKKKLQKNLYAQYPVRLDSDEVIQYERQH